MTTLQIEARKLRPGEATPTQEPAKWPEGALPNPIQEATATEEGEVKASWVSAEAGFPQTLAFGSLLDDRLRLLKPLEVQLEQEGEWYIARCGEVDAFGYGEDSFQAVDDLRQSFAELYWTLKASQEQLAKGLSSVWKHLRELVEEQ
ncbi:MAG TPA: hypothetical protein VJM51_01110 [Dehalococcoidia bacterium]|nr:hypothetical protein [Dehalococcoidia bacterium]